MRAVVRIVTVVVSTGLILLVAGAGKAPAAPAAAPVPAVAPQLAPVVLKQGCLGPDVVCDLGGKVVGGVK